METGGNERNEGTYHGFPPTTFARTARGSRAVCEEYTGRHRRKGRVKQRILAGGPWEERWNGSVVATNSGKAKLTGVHAHHEVSSK